ncbi:MAG: tRNA 2-selenouridine(34) synthase MnmH [Dethiobacter sp.]|nr:tRNA 2-selenouridine(34) synthase MnmH [Dethiobacter sp.]
MKTMLQAVNLIDDLNKYFIVDVRSPGEFNEASIPGAVNVPLFTDEERVIVGTTYWKEGTDRAKLVGLSLVAPKLPGMVESILTGAAGREIVLYCWRGGMRSKSVAAVLDMLGYPVQLLLGGYKAFRRQVSSYLTEASLSTPVFVLNGLTGVGKTLVIKQLQAMSAPALDLEAMANHRGSVFGGVGLGGPHSQKDFEVRLVLALKEHCGAPYLIVEGEGKRIGPVTVPEFFHQAMRNSPHILLATTIDVRVQRIMDEYSGCAAENTEDLAKAVISLEKRLGREKCEMLSTQIRTGNYGETVKILCTEYYDRYYKDSRQNKGDYLGVVDVTEISAGAQKVVEIIAAYMEGRAEGNGGICGVGTDL